MTSMRPLRPAAEMRPPSSGLCLRRQHQVHGFRALALLVRLDLETDTLSFGQILQARALHRRDVHEHVASTVVRLDEAVAALTIEELDCPSHGHRETPPPQCFLHCALCAASDRTSL